ncbi:hypothetical protein V8J88_24175 [Massilia sp. W12]|uniref:hypothetical protein n=1 Tax=Massilia sp. W12 TaxID=3126507 RepID=UPI0030D270A0
MANVDGMALMMAIQAVDAKITTLIEELENNDSPQAGELEALLLSYEKAAMKLKIAYEEELKTASNFPPYERLVAD